MATPANKIQEVYQRLNKRFVEKLSQEDLKEGEKLFFEHAGDEDCHHHECDSAEHHSHVEAGHDCHHGSEGHDHHHSGTEDYCDPEQEDRNMKLPGFRGYWCKELFVVQAEMVKGAFKVVTDKQFVSKSFFKCVKSVATFGCGPGSDLIGFLAFLEELPHENQPSSTPVLLGIDAEEGWKEYVEEAGCKFECSRVDTQYLKDMPKHDIIIMCCFASHMGLHQCQEGERNNLDIIAEKCKFLMVLDFDDPPLDAALKERQVFYHNLPGECAIFPGYALNVYAKLLK